MYYYMAKDIKYKQANWSFKEKFGKIFENKRREATVTEITDVKIRYLRGDGRMKAVASITLDNELAIHDIKIIETEGKVFLSMPSRRLSDGTYRDLVHPTNAQLRSLLHTRIMEMYKDVPSMLNE